MRCPYCVGLVSLKRELDEIQEVENRKAYQVVSQKRKDHCSCSGESIQRYGHYRRKSDSRTIQRFYCKCCKQSYSYAQKDPAYQQNRRRLNIQLRNLLASAVSMRRAAILLGTTRKTVARKLKFLGQESRIQQVKYLRQREPVTQLQFDELQTIEHSKCKPLSVATMVSTTDRKILGTTVSCMPATGHLAKISRKKYGHRPDRRQAGLKQLFRQVRGTLASGVQILSDEHPYYEPIVKKSVPDSHYRQVKGAKSSVGGQGELKKQGNDPLFYINHTLAMLRANINRLFRKTWCTTKDPARLADHLAIYTAVHNEILTA